MLTPKPSDERKGDTLNLLLVEDNPGDARLVQESLRDERSGDFRLSRATHLQEALGKLSQMDYDAVLLDLSLPDSRGLDTFLRIRDTTDKVPVVIFTGLDDREIAIQAVQEGAQDYLVKGEVNDGSLTRAIHYAVERHRITHLLQQTEERLDSFLEHTYDLVQIANAEGSLRFVNRSWMDTLGHSADDICRLSYLDVVDPDSKEHWKEIFQRASGGSSSPLVSVTFRNTEGEKIFLEGGVYASSPHGGKRTISAVLRNITERQLEEERIKYLAHHDGLTGLPNRRLFNDRLEQLLIRSSLRNRSLAVLFLDLDHFKPVNDNHGHQTGDLLLMTVAERLKECLREGDTVARIGGDEFAIILADIAQAADVSLVAQKIKTALSQTCQLKELNLSIQASIGISVFPEDGTTAKALLNRADQAMYEVKAAGRNHYQRYSPQDDN